MESRRYPTDLSDDEWCCLSPHLPEPAGWGRPRLHGLRAILDAVFYVLSRAAAPGGYCPGTSRLRRPSTSGSGDGASTGRGSVRTPNCASACGRGLAGTRTPVAGSWTPGSRRRPEWAERKEATTGARRSAVPGGICWWILKV